jgi:hypothetical protein
LLRLHSELMASESAADIAPNTRKFLAELTARTRL